MGEASHAAAAREIAAWETLCDELKTAGREVLATAPGDELTGAEGLRYVARLTAAFLRLVTADPVPARQPGTGLGAPHDARGRYQFALGKKAARRVLGNRDRRSRDGCGF